MELVKVGLATTTAARAAKVDARVNFILTGWCW